MLKALIVLGLIGFGFFLASERGLITLALDSDKSYISYLILGIYVLATAHWLWLARALAKERSGLAGFEEALSDTGERAPVGAGHDGSRLEALLVHLRRRSDPSEANVLVEAFGDEIANDHALGHLATDVLLRLGLLGTIVGFIFMLLPIADMRGFDAGMMQQLLTAMSGGMAVALYTTLAGLVTSTLLKVQYHMLDAAAADLVTRLAVLVDVRLAGAGSAL